MIKPDLTAPVPENIQAIHFVGIGGSGMSGIARLFLARGKAVSGSDRSESANVEQLRALGATVHIGHDAAHLGAVDAVVVTSALWPENPELVAAQGRGIPILHRSQALAWLVADSRLVSVAGAHGKTTSTGMIVTGLHGLGADPSFVNGGVIEPLGVSSAPGGDDLFVVEADESDGSFLLYNTAVALITNVDPDHLDHYGSLENFVSAFVEFANKASEVVVISADDVGAREVRSRLSHQNVVTFGQSQQADVRITEVSENGPLTFAIEFAGVRYPASLSVPGLHNAINAAGAFAVLIGLGWDPAQVVEAVSAFGGTKRRFERHAVIGGVSVYDDYAHHPTEVAAALSAARSVVGDGRIIAVHQPHLYSRTKAFAGEFAETLEMYADHTIVLDVCGAREDPIPGVTGALVAERFRDSTNVDYEPDWTQAATRTAAIAQDGDFVITLGCGDVNLLIPQLLSSLERERGQGA